MPVMDDPFACFQRDDLWDVLARHPDTRPHVADTGFREAIEKLRGGGQDPQSRAAAAMKDPRVMQAVAVLQADGNRESTIVSSRGKCAEVILNAEGARTQEVQLAKGEAESKLMLARAEAECISILRAALDKLGFAKRRAVDYMVSVQWLRNMERMSHASEGHTVLVPRNIFDSLRAAGKLS